MKTSTNKGVTNEKTTIYLDPKIKKSVRYYAVRDDKSLSQIINDKLFEYLEDQEDIAAAEAARCDGEQAVSFEDALKELGISLDEVQARSKA
jgi:predicted transcriptional regulator